MSDTSKIVTALRETSDKWKDYMGMWYSVDCPVPPAQAAIAKAKGDSDA